MESPAARLHAEVIARVIREHSTTRKRRKQTHRLIDFYRQLPVSKTQRAIASIFDTRRSNAERILLFRQAHDHFNSINPANADNHPAVTSEHIDVLSSLALLHLAEYQHDQAKKYFDQLRACHHNGYDYQYLESLLGNRQFSQLNEELNRLDRLRQAPYLNIFKSISTSAESQQPDSIVNVARRHGINLATSTNRTATERLIRRALCGLGHYRTLSDSYARQAISETNPTWHSQAMILATVSGLTDHYKLHNIRFRSSNNLNRRGNSMWRIHAIIHDLFDNGVIDGDQKNLFKIHDKVFKPVRSVVQGSTIASQHNRIAEISIFDREVTNCYVGIVALLSGRYNEGRAHLETLATQHASLLHLGSQHARSYLAFLDALPAEQHEAIRSRTPLFAIKEDSTSHKRGGRSTPPSTNQKDSTQEESEAYQDSPTGPRRNPFDDF